MEKKFEKYRRYEKTRSLSMNVIRDRAAAAAGILFALTVAADIVFNGLGSMLSKNMTGFDEELNRVLNVESEVLFAIAGYYFGSSRREAADERSSKTADDEKSS